jgi:hypothetical protein
MPTQHESIPPERGIMPAAYACMPPPIGMPPTLGGMPLSGAITPQRGGSSFQSVFLYSPRTGKRYKPNSGPPSQMQQPPMGLHVLTIKYSSPCVQPDERNRATLYKDEGTETSYMRASFITYNSTVHFYHIRGYLAQPQMIVVEDVEDMFMPLLEGFLYDPVESETAINSLMEQIPAMFADTRETETILGLVIQAGLEALKVQDLGHAV